MATLSAEVIYCSLYVFVCTNSLHGKLPDDHSPCVWEGLGAEEAVSINQSLSSLGRVVITLIENNKVADEGEG